MTYDRDETLSSRIDEIESKIRNLLLKNQETEKKIEAFSAGAFWNHQKDTCKTKFVA